LKQPKNLTEQGASLIDNESELKSASDKMQVVYVNVDDVKIGKRIRKDMGDIKELAELIIKVNLINPIQIDKDMNLVAGHRRLLAYKYLLWKTIPAVITNENAFDVEVIENQARKDFTIDEIVKIADRVEPEIKAEAEARKKAGIPSSDSDAGRTDDTIAKIVGVSRDTLRKMRTIIRDAPEPLKEKVRQKTVSVNKGYKQTTELNKVKEVSHELFKKVQTSEIPIKRALEVVETIEKIEKKGVTLEPEQKQKLADKVAEDEKLLEKYEEDVLARVQKVMTTPKAEQENPTEPIGRVSPVNKIVKVRDEIQNNFRRYIGHCTLNERSWAKRVINEIQSELTQLQEILEN